MMSEIWKGVAMRSLFAHRLREKAVTEQRKITLEDVAGATHVHINTLSRWSQPKTMQKIDVEVLYALCTYFKCEMTGLLEFVHPNQNPN